MAITLPFSFVNGTTADAIQVNANMSALSNGALPIVGVTQTSPMTGPIWIQTSGTGNNSYVTFLTSGGTPTAPTALPANTPIGGVYAGGYDGVAWSDGGECAIDFFTGSDPWTPSEHVTYMVFGTTAKTETHARDVMELHHLGPFAVNSSTALYLLVKDSSGATSMQNVVLGPVDSGGTGFRTLCVAST